MNGELVVRQGLLASNPESVAKPWRSRRGRSGSTRQGTHGPKRQERRMAGMMPKSGKHAYDLWDETNSKPKKKAKSIAVPTGKLALDGMAPIETVHMANPLLVPAMDPIFDAPAQSAPTL